MTRLSFNLICGIFIFCLSTSIHHANSLPWQPDDAYLVKALRRIILEDRDDGIVDWKKIFEPKEIKLIDNVAKKRSKLLNMPRWGKRNEYMPLQSIIDDDYDKRSFKSIPRWG
ncbi:hypothetical protein SNEBB_000657 [Seison nebaliae]|nr:hypothetical protein SNEBB_000657 [Seison nebaliae]